MKTVIQGSSVSQTLIIENNVWVKKAAPDFKDFDWVDEKSGIAKHKKTVTEVVIFDDEYNEFGRTGKSNRITIHKNDILSLAQKIKEIEAEEFDDIVQYD